MTREPSIPQPPFDIPPATRDENAPHGPPIRATGFRPHGRDRSHYTAKSEKAERATRENLTLHNHRMGHNIDENALPLDKLFR